MAKKKVFSLEKFKTICRAEGDCGILIYIWLRSWAEKCDGLTEEEILERHKFRVEPAWMVEVNDEESV